MNRVVKYGLFGLLVGLAFDAAAWLCDGVFNGGSGCLMYAIPLLPGYIVWLIPGVERLFHKAALYLPGDSDALTILVGGPLFYMLLGLLVGYIIEKIKTQKEEKTSVFAQ